MDWYHAFIAIMAVVWLGATTHDRPAARIVLGASVLSELLVDGVTCCLTGGWKLTVPGVLELATIGFLVACARNRTGLLNVALLAFAWLAHVVCFLDWKLGTDVVYSRYETVLAVIAGLQLLTFHDTLRYLVVSWPRVVRAGRVAVLRPANLRALVLPRARV